MNKKKLLKFIGYYQFIAGIIGLLNLALLLAKAEEIKRLLSGGYFINFVILNILALLLNILTIYAGFFLLKNRKEGIVMSIILNIIQIPRFALFGYMYFFVIGLHVSIGYGFGQFLFNYFIGSYFRVGTTPDTNYLSLNIISLAIVYFLYKNLNSNKLNQSKNDNQ